MNMYSISIFLAVEKPSGLWEWFIGTVFGGIANYGLRIIIFTLALRILLLPLDFYQKKTMSDNARKMKIMQPKIKKLQEQFGHDRALFQQKQMELYRKEKYSMLSSCLPMIVTMVVFFSMFAGFTNITHYMNMTIYQKMYNEYTQTYNNKALEGEDYTPYSLDKLQEELDALRPKHEELILANITLDFPSYTDEQKNQILDEIFTARSNAFEVTLPPYSPVFDKDYTYREMVVEARVIIAQRAVENLYETSEKQGFLGMIKSIWTSDVPWERPIQSKEKFENGLRRNALVGGNKGKEYLEQYGDIINDYDIVMKGLTDKYSSTPNGYMVLVVLAAGLSFFSSWIAAKQQKSNMPAQGEQAAAMGNSMMKTMLWLMPLMLGFFAATNSAAFSIYMVSNSAFGLGFGQLISYLLKKYDAAREKRELETVHVLRRGK